MADKPAPAKTLMQELMSGRPPKDTTDCKKPAKTTKKGK